MTTGEMLYASDWFAPGSMAQVPGVGAHVRDPVKLITKSGDSTPRCRDGREQGLGITFVKSVWRGESLDREGIERPLQASYHLRVAREFLRTCGRAVASNTVATDSRPSGGAVALRRRCQT
jgi:hypothetical protein